MGKQKPIYKTMKVFDSQWDPGMPKDVKKAFFDHFRDTGTGNDVYVTWAIQDEVFKDENSEWALNKKKVDDWLIANGADAAKDDKSEGETVLIKHWW